MTHFISLDEVEGLTAIEWEGAKVSTRYDRLQARLNQALPDSAGLFAEPVWAADGGPAAVSWYTRHEGEAVPFSALPAQEQAGAATRIRHAVEDLVPLLRDADFGPLLGRCLLVPDLEDVLLVGGRPVLRNWGWVLPQFGSGDAGLSSAWQAGLGRLLPGFPRPWEIAETPTSGPARSDPLAAALPPPRAWWGRPGTALPAMLGLLTLGAAASYAGFRQTMPGLDPAKQAERNLISERQTIVDERIGAFKAALDGGLCTAEGADTAPLDPPSAARLLSRTVGRVIVPGMANPARGTAVFVSKERVVTQAATLDGVGDRPIFIESTGLGRSFRAEPEQGPAQDGISVLRLPAPARFAVPLRSASGRAPGTAAYTGAMPGFVNPWDSSFIAMRKTDVEESPIPMVSRMTIGTGLDPVALPASALPPGGEGSPVIDACGRMIGIARRSGSLPAGQTGVPGSQSAKTPCLAMPDFLNPEQVKR